MQIKLKKIVVNNKPDHVIFPSQSTLDIYLKSNLFKRSRREVIHCCIESVEGELTEVKNIFFTTEIPPVYMDMGTQFYFPDPTTELHPDHRKWGGIGEQLLRQGFDVTFYTTNMNAPYMREVGNPEAKKRLLDAVYPSQKSLWEYDHKYFLFEGGCRWVM